jgi:hypothetical protein
MSETKKRACIPSRPQPWDFGEEPVPLAKRIRAKRLSSLPWKWQGSPYSIAEGKSRTQEAA